MTMKRVMSWDETTLKELKEKSNYEIEYAYEIGKITGRRELLDKACKWLSENLDKYVGEGGWNIWDDDPNCETYADIVARDFRKAMED